MVGISDVITYAYFGEDRLGGSKGTRAGIRVTQAYTVAAVSAFFDRRRRRHRAVASPA